MQLLRNEGLRDFTAKGLLGLMGADVSDEWVEAFGSAGDGVRQAIASDDAVLRWWGLTSTAWFTSVGWSPQIDARTLLSDERSFVRSRAAILCAMQGERLGKEQWLSILNHARNGAEVLLVLNDLTYAVEQGLVEPFALEMSELRFTCTGVDWRLQYLNAWAANPQHATTPWSRIY